MHTAYIGAGSNTGAREQYLLTALNLLADSESVTLEAVSSIYESSPLGGKTGHPFLNLVFRIMTTLTPQELFELLKKTEIKTGRIERPKWTDREIDLDVLLYDNLILKTEKLEIPHKEMLHRDFVLYPLLELDGALMHPLHNAPLSLFAAGLSQKYISAKFPAAVILENGRTVLRYE